MNSEKKGRNLGIRFSDQSLADIERIATQYHTTPSTLARALLEEFTKAVNAHGSAVAWPPRFHVVIKTEVDRSSEAVAAAPKPVARPIPLPRRSSIATAAATGAGADAPTRRTLDR